MRVDHSLRSHRRLVALGISAVLVLAACGGSTPSVPVASTGTGSAPSAGSGTPDLASATTVDEVLTAVDGLDAAAREAALLAKAQTEGPIALYGTLNIESSAGLMEEFIKAYPTLKEVHFTLSGSALIERVLIEAGGGVDFWDIALANPDQLVAFKENDLITQYRGPSLDVIPAQFKDPDGWWVDAYVTYNGTMYNKDKVATPPATYEDLTDPKWKGQFVLDTEEFEWYVMMLQELGQDAGTDLMQRLAANEPVMVRGGGTQRDRVISGESWVVMSNSDELMLREIKSGAPVELTYLEPSIAKHAPAHIAKRAPNPGAAVLFYDWLLSLEGQQAIHDRLTRNMVHPDVVDNNPELTTRREGVEFKSVDLNTFAADYEKIQTDYRALFVD